jgi:hypothetical protein
MRRVQSLNQNTHFLAWCQLGLRPRTGRSGQRASRKVTTARTRR